MYCTDQLRIKVPLEQPKVFHSEVEKESNLEPELESPKEKVDLLAPKANNPLARGKYSRNKNKR